MQMAATLVFWMKDSGEGTTLLTATAMAPRRSQTSVGVAVVARRKNLRFVGSAVSNRDAQHLPGSQRDRALHDEQEHSHEFDNGGGHLFGSIIG